MKAISKINNTLAKIEGAVMVFWFAIVLVVMTCQVVSRYIFNAPIAWSEEFARYSFVWISYIGCAYCVSVDAHTGITAFRDALPPKAKKLTTVLGTGAMTADTILDEQKLQLALAKLQGRENADVMRTELTIRAAALREKLTAAEHDHLGTRRLLRAFPDMKSLNYADTLAATRAAMLRLRELAAAAKDAARETAANAKEKIKKA